MFNIYNTNETFLISYQVINYDIIELSSPSSKIYTTYIVFKCVFPGSLGDKF